MGALAQTKMTVADYLELDERTEPHLEFHDGEVFPIVDATPAHALLGAQIAAVLGTRLPQSCKALMQGRIRTSAKHYVYADLSVVCGKPAQFSKKDYSITNPRLVIEILSPSTTDYDRGGKFDLYQLLPTFSEYVLVEQSEPRVLCFRKTAKNNWTLEILTSLEEVLRLESVGISMTLDEIYRDILP